MIIYGILRLKQKGADISSKNGSFPTVSCCGKLLRDDLWGEMWELRECGMRDSVGVYKLSHRLFEGLHNFSS